MDPLQLPPHSPDLNAHAERCVRSIKSECLSRLIFLSEGALRRAIHAFVSHYHEERNHQGLGNELIEPNQSDRSADGPIRCLRRLGGLLKYYHRDAAG